MKAMQCNWNKCWPSQWKVKELMMVCKLLYKLVLQVVLHEALVRFYMNGLRPLRGQQKHNRNKCPLAPKTIIADTLWRQIKLQAYESCYTTKCYTVWMLLLLLLLFCNFKWRLFQAVRFLRYCLWILNKMGLFFLSADKVLKWQFWILEADKQWFRAVVNIYNACLFFKLLFFAALLSVISSVKLCSCFHICQVEHFLLLLITFAPIATAHL